MKSGKALSVIRAVVDSLIFFVFFKDRAASTDF